MATTVTDKFSALVQNLRTDNDSVIAARRKAIIRRINLDFRGLDSETLYSRYVGSYGRGTAIKGFSDVDLLAILPVEEYNRYKNYAYNGQSSLLQAVRNSIRTTYPTTEVGGDGQVVVVTFSDGVKFEVVPCFLNTDNVSYTYPDSNSGGTWKITNPVPEIEALDQANATYNKKVKHLCRMARAWKQKCDVPISGLLIDTMAYNFMPGWQYKDKSYLYYDYMTRDFLLYLSQRDRQQQYWRSPGSQQYVWRTGAFEAKAETAYAYALAAIQYESEEKTYSANEYWKAIFGSFFAG